jgi:hypothetical protein
MGTSFHPNNLLACFSPACENKPEFKVVQWLGEGLLDDGEKWEAGTAVMLTCRSCMIEQLEAFRDEQDGTLSADIPTLGFIALPMRLTQGQVESLREEITPHVWLDRENLDQIC